MSKRARDEATEAHALMTLPLELLVHIASNTETFTLGAWKLVNRECLAKIAQVRAALGECCLALLMRCAPCGRTLLYHDCNKKAGAVTDWCMDGAGVVAVTRQSKVYHAREVVLGPREFSVRSCDVRLYGDVEYAVGLDRPLHCYGYMGHYKPSTSFIDMTRRWVRETGLHTESNLIFGGRFFWRAPYAPVTNHCKSLRK